MEHVETAKTASERASLEQRLTGRFYTPLVIAEKMADLALAACPSPTSVGDPFCGDGRLVLAWLRRAARSSGICQLSQIYLWDYDAAAVAEAKARVAAALTELGIFESVSIVADSGDTFSRVDSMRGRISTLLTNPPWELLKPDVRDGLDELDTQRTFTGQLRGYAAKLAQDFPGALSERGKAMTGYGVNLARAGAIASAMLAADGGAVTIVLPASIFADQASAPFRREFFNRLRLSQLDWYPAEARLFDGVDQSFVTVTATAGSPTNSFFLNRFDKNLELLEHRQTSMLEDRSTPLALQVAGSHERLVRQLAAEHPPLSLLESDLRFGLWLGRELDETRIAEALTERDDGVPFLKGRHVFPFQVSRDKIWRIDPTKRPIPASTREARLAWRDVSRPNQRRRMHVALVPKGDVTGNSLGVAFFRGGPLEHIRILMAIMNSLVFEMQVRSHLATAHVSQGVLRRCSIPLSCFMDAALRNRLLALVNARLASFSESPQLEVAIARAYGLYQEDFATVLAAFPKLTERERLAHLESELWS